MCVFNKEDPQEALASWLLVEFLLDRRGADSLRRNRGLCARDPAGPGKPGLSGYLSEAGKDAEHYQVKIDATATCCFPTRRTPSSPARRTAPPPCGTRPVSSSKVLPSPCAASRPWTRRLSKSSLPTPRRFTIWISCRPRAAWGAGETGPPAGNFCRAAGVPGGDLGAAAGKWLIDAIKMKKLQIKDNWLI